MSLSSSSFNKLIKILEIMKILRIIYTTQLHDEKLQIGENNYSDKQ